MEKAREGHKAARIGGCKLQQEFSREPGRAGQAQARAPKQISTRKQLHVTEEGAGQLCSQQMRAKAPAGITGLRTPWSFCLRALLPRPTPLPCFLQTSSFHSLSFPLEQPGKSLEGDTAQHPTANTQPGLTLHAGCCGLRVSPVGPLSKPETGALLLPPPFHRGASWGVGWHSQPWRSAGQALGRPTPLTKAHAGRKPAAWAC